MWCRIIDPNTKSNSPSDARSNASAATGSIVVIPSAAQRSRKVETATSLRSTAITIAPCLAKYREYSPVPQPRSSNRGALDRAEVGERGEPDAVVVGKHARLAALVDRVPVLDRIR